MKFRVVIAQDLPKPGVQVFAPTLASARELAKKLAVTVGREAEIWEHTDTLVERVSPQEPVE